MAELTGELRARLLQALASLLVPGEAVALLNFPQHGNAGDPAIWLGTLSLLAELGHPVAYACTPRTYDEVAMRAACPDGAVLLNGGGNFGDLYGPQQELREFVLRTLRDRRVVQLPQSIYFRDPQALDRMQRLVAHHPSFTLLVREARSAERAAAFDCPMLLVPDLAWCLGPQRGDDPVGPILWLERDAGSPEAVPGQVAPSVPDVERVEWLAGLPADQAAWPEERRHQLDLAHEFVGASAEAALRRRVGWPELAATFRPLAEAWVDRGLALLSRGEVVVTDRLHGHVLSLLLGRPHVVLDNAYGKCSSTLDTWSGQHPLVHRAASVEQALELARHLV